jgi:hypothetical protein
MALIELNRQQLMPHHTQTLHKCRFSHVTSHKHWWCSRAPLSLLTAQAALLCQLCMAHASTHLRWQCCAVHAADVRKQSVLCMLFIELCRVTVLCLTDHPRRSKCMSCVSLVEMIQQQLVRMFYRLGQCCCCHVFHGEDRWRTVAPLCS